MRCELINGEREGKLQKKELEQGLRAGRCSCTWTYLYVSVLSCFSAGSIHTGSFEGGQSRKTDELGEEDEKGKTRKKVLVFLWLPVRIQMGNLCSSSFFFGMWDLLTRD